jgi:hypothetical protein
MPVYMEGKVSVSVMKKRVRSTDEVFNWNGTQRSRLPWPDLVSSITCVPSSLLGALPPRNLPRATRSLRSFHIIIPPSSHAPDLADILNRCPLSILSIADSAPQHPQHHNGGRIRATEAEQQRQACIAR